MAVSANSVAVISLVLVLVVLAVSAFFDKPSGK
jgi:hypothetical protein